MCMFLFSPVFVGVNMNHSARSVRLVNVWVFRYSLLQLFFQPCSGSCSQRAFMGPETRALSTHCSPIKTAGDRLTFATPNTSAGAASCSLGLYLVTLSKGDIPWG